MDKLGKESEEILIEQEKKQQELEELTTRCTDLTLKMNV